MTGGRCELCPRQCGAPRSAHGGEGLCGMGTVPVIARAAPHYGEEPCISGERGSGAIFFCGCPLGCVFCQNAEISREGAPGIPMPPAMLGALFADLRAQGVHNINLVTASHVVPAVARALRESPPGIPVVYNSSGYETERTLRMLQGLVDIYLPDYKYADADTARICAGAPDYPETALRAVTRMRRQTGEARYDAQGLMLRGTMVRHLVLPGLTGMSMRALNRLDAALPKDVPISLMGQYTPYGKALQIKGLDRPLLAREYRRVAAHLRALKRPGYIQSLRAQGTEMIPVWDWAGREFEDTRAL